MRKGEDSYRRNWRDLMHPRHSKMEMDVLLALTRERLHPCTDKSFCVVSTVPDFYFPERKLAVYLDGEKVHLKRQDKDERLRTLLRKRHGVKVLSIMYNGNSKRKTREIVEQIKEALM